ncbi:hypothetical protein Tco_1070401 [Tanacetum coccineum]|uniref:Uncharacterized protein n=1 Tax=Tanacetum coccineum TaxID=301880 RepID=A0ABQ5HME9_9ASTR
MYIMMSRLRTRVYSPGPFWGVTVWYLEQGYGSPVMLFLQRISREADPLESSPPPVSVAPTVSPFLCLDDSESDTKMPERHVSLTPHDDMLTRWRSRAE